MFASNIGFALTFLVVVNAAPTSILPARWCVTSDAEEAKCKALKQNLHERNILPGIDCIRAQDKYDCMAQIENRNADVSCYWSMDTYVAGKHHGLVPFLSEKHTSEDGWTYAYYALALIHKSDDSIHSLEDLRGKKSCHTGVNRHVGWLYPTSQFVQRGFFQDADCVNNVANVAKFFNASCVSGVKNSAFDPDGKYDNMCQLCGGDCSSNDPYASYTGSLKCLLDKRGDVAFIKDTTWGEVLKERPEIAEKRDDYRLLCLDGSRKPLDDYKECNWGTIPERACMTSPNLPVEQMIAIQDMLIMAQSDQSTFKMFESTNYGGKSLMFGDYTKQLAPVGDKNDYVSFLGDYMNVREKQFACEAPAARWCTISDAEQSKCHRMRDALAARFIRPDIECVKSSDTAACLKDIHDGKVDLISLDGGDIYKGGKEYSVQVIANENAGAGKAKYYAVAVAKKENADLKLTNLNGKKSCHTGIGRTAGWNIPAGTLLSSGQISMPADCNIAEAVGNYFSASCAPGALLSAYNPTGKNPASLCELCAGSGDAKCSRTENEPFYGYTGAFRCMATGVGDVAFVKHVTALSNTDGKNQDEWAKNLHSQDFELLCKDGTRKPITDYASCNLARVASHGIVTAGDKDTTKITQYNFMLQLGSIYYGKNSTPNPAFQLFQSGPGAKDLLFSDSTSGIEVIPPPHRPYRAYLGDIADVFDHISQDSCKSTK
uniref:Transferrin-like domain-containing protein n=1 Tax=Strigamia maritima TaxID=126957 RepID=T1IIX4_STRMM